MASKRPVVLASGEAQELASGDSLLVPTVTFENGSEQYGAANSPTAEYFWDFPCGSDGGNYTAGTITGGTYPAVTNAEEAGAFGCVGISCGTSANSGAYWSPSSNGSTFRLVNGDVCKIRLQVSNGRIATSKVRLGIQAAFNTSDETHEVSFVINAGVVTGRCRNASSETSTATMLTVTGDLWYGYEIKYTTTSVEFNVYSATGSFLATATVTTNIPSNTAKRPGVIATSSGTTAGRLCLIDYIYVKTAVTDRFF